MLIIIYLFSLRPGVLIKTLSHIWGRLNLPILLLRVGLLTLIKMDSMIYLDQMVPLPPYYFEVVVVNRVFGLVVVMMNG